MNRAGLTFAVFSIYIVSSSAGPVAGILEQHNVYRCMHNANRVTYSLSLETDAQEYADKLATDCKVNVDHDQTLDAGVGENLAFCATPPDPEESCSSGSYATPDWYAEVEWYIDDPSMDYTTRNNEDTGHFTQVVWKSTNEIGCAESSCTVGTVRRTYVVCRYRDGGNIAGQYTENVEGTPSESFEQCTELVGGGGDPHMSGFKGQKFDFTGKEDTWYALVHDRGIAINMHITAPVPGVQEITYITGLGLSLMGADSIMHTAEIIIDSPHDLNPVCDESNGAPCLADGALTIVVDGEHAGAGQVKLGGGVFVSALNIPGECRPFGFEKYWLEKQKAADHRALRSAFSPGMWLMKDTKRTDPEACDKYVEEASAAGTLFHHQSEHASFQITAPDLSLRVNIGKIHQLAMRDPTNKFDLPDHVAYQMNIAFEAIDVSEKSQGVLGETVMLAVDGAGAAIVKGPDCIRGEEEDYIVSGPLDTNFSLNL